MRLSAAGRAFIENEEGLRLEAYPDSDPEDTDRLPVWTIGYGHTGKDVHDGLIWTREQADDAFFTDSRWVERVINQYCRIPPTQNEFDAMFSLTYNIGSAGFHGSTVLRLYNANDLQGAADAFLLWRRPARLLPRRMRERALFLKG